MDTPTPARESVDPVIRPILDLDGALPVAFDRSFDAPTPADRLRQVKRAAHALRERLLSGPRVRYYGTFDLIRAPYPTRYALRDATWVPTPFVHIVNRLFVIQFNTPEGVKTLLAEPLDREGNAQTPFFKRLGDSLGGADGPLGRRLYPPLGDVLALLRALGIAPEDVAYITYDHLHTQDIRKWLGTGDRPGAFPNAKLLVMREEWDIARDPLPIQRDWYPPQGIAGVPAERVILLDHSVTLGDGVALVRTPGHTDGNHSIVAHTAEGLFVTSENGVGADAYAPTKSRIPGLRRYAKDTGMEVVLNGNTLEGSTEQYLSMILERELAGASVRNPDFYNIANSSEMSADWRSPGLDPTFTFGPLAFGTPVTRGGVAHGAAR